jgi:hypothetical protein
MNLIDYIVVETLYLRSNRHIVDNERYPYNFKCVWNHAQFFFHPVSRKIILCTAHIIRMLAGPETYGFPGGKLICARKST